jgi:hypothetical protein
MAPLPARCSQIVLQARLTEEALWCKDPRPKDKFITERRASPHKLKRFPLHCDPWCCLLVFPAPDMYRLVQPSITCCPQLLYHWLTAQNPRVSPSLSS